MKGLTQQLEYTLWALWHQRMLKPTTAVSSFAELKLPRDTKVVILDKDNTFSEPHKLTVWPSLQARWSQLLKECQDKDCQVVVLSNTAGDATADPSDKLAAGLEATLRVPVLRHEQKKPMCYQEVGQKYAAQGIKPEQILVVGDRLLTDILMANLMGSRSVWIRPGLHPNFYNKVECALASR